MTDYKVLCNGDEAYLPRHMLCKFQVLNRMIMDISQTDNIDSVIIDQPLELDCSPEIFNLMVDWLRHHQDDSDTYWNGVKIDDDPMTGSQVEPVIGWDKTFLEKLDRVTYYTFVMAAIDLEVLGLTTMICRDMANRIMVEPDMLSSTLQIEDCVQLLTTSE